MAFDGTELAISASMKQWGQTTSKYNASKRTYEDMIGMAAQVQANLRELAKAKQLQRKMLLDEIAEKQFEVEHVEASLARIRSKSKLASSFRCQAKWGVATASIGLANCKREISKLKAFSQSPSASSQ